MKYFDRHSLARGRGAAMHLRDAAGPDWTWIDVRKQVRQRRSEGGLDGCARVLDTVRGHGVVQRRECAAHGERQHIGPR